MYLKTLGWTPVHFRPAVFPPEAVYPPCVCRVTETDPYSGNGAIKVVSDGCKDTDRRFFRDNKTVLFHLHALPSALLLDFDVILAHNRIELYPFLVFIEE
uniref:Glycosyltransferase family 92 protein n=1 Tax=Panagrellus redivivus TaxID=6233 RepID=A0A7E4VK06_PANRE